MEQSSFATVIISPEAATAATVTPSVDNDDNDDDDDVDDDEDEQDQQQDNIYCDSSVEPAIITFEPAIIAISHSSPSTIVTKTVPKVARKRQEYSARKSKKAKTTEKDKMPSVKIVAKSNLFVVNNKNKYWAYINGMYGNWTVHELITGYQKHGFLALCLMDLAGNPTETEQRRINILQQLIESKKEIIKDESRAEQTRIINTCEVTDENEEDTKSDNLRRSSHLNFPAEGDDLSNIITNMEQVFKHIGCIHPRTTATNSQGYHGVDVIAKLKGLGIQEPHYDYAVYFNNPEFLSWADTNTNPHKRSNYSDARDGGSSLFINPLDRIDSLQKPNGEFIIFPPYTYSILRGNIAHRGTGNYTSTDIYKIFAYFDPPNYPRLNDKTIQFKVYHFNSDTQIIRKNTTPFKHVVTERIAPYPCVTCHTNAMFTYPYCTRHLLSECGLLPFIREDTKTPGTKFICSTVLKSNSRLPGLVDLEIMSKEMFMERYPHLGTHGIIGAIPLPHDENKIEQDFVGCLTTIPFASLFQKSTLLDSCNVKCAYDADGRIYFHTLKPIGNLDPIVLLTGNSCDSGLKMDTNHDRLDMIYASQRRLSNKCLKGVTL
jgi:hypothetical protein